MSKKILTIGAVPKEGVPSTYGGITVLMQMLIDFLVRNGCPFHHIMANRYMGMWGRFLNFPYVCFMTLLQLPKCKVIMVNGADKSTFILAPVIFCLAKIFRKKFVFRKFGGSFDKMFVKASSFKKSLVRKTVFKADMILAETHGIVNFLTNQGCKNVRWFPNVRLKPTETKSR